MFKTLLIIYLFSFTLCQDIKIEEDDEKYILTKTGIIGRNHFVYKFTITKRKPIDFNGYYKNIPTVKPIEKVSSGGGKGILKIGAIVFGGLFSCCLFICSCCCRCCKKKETNIHEIVISPQEQESFPYPDPTAIVAQDIPRIEQLPPPYTK